MPHLTVEYSANLQQLPAPQLLQRLNDVLLQSGQFAGPDIKSRALPLPVFLVGDEPAGHAFVHVKLALLSGRPPEVKKMLSQQLLDALQSVCDWPAELAVQLCVELMDIDRAGYSKTVME
ncbi:5-carboxymethyl-2-hydroxymuconate Delta-isomerase [Vogesella sp. LIG4]|uniref:5-carboxymethyl-2-hydroxymuconate Delta-isomerase n=1 Tax=Vogesella sp. LIG4 TaxID=1192162 RepID=UPI00081FE0B0|nr:5-carboxymethyl-2-hydroxymuconate Delta-isomerase [Vogesella sp. LIG4]SCK15579.1 5-carboxymethyl-2-hydroxymuconate isomerase [Vogesella sp. LIG4]